MMNISNKYFLHCDWPIPNHIFRPMAIAIIPTLLDPNTEAKRTFFSEAANPMCMPLPYFFKAFTSEYLASLIDVIACIQ